MRLLSSLVTVDSPEHFKDLLSEDLTRVSVLNFWAPWADVCKGMNEVRAPLAFRCAWEVGTGMVSCVGGVQASRKKHNMGDRQEDSWRLVL